MRAVLFCGRRFLGCGGYPAIQRLMDQCAADPATLRTKTKFPEEWPPASSPVHPVTIVQMQEWIAEKQSLREFASTLHTSRSDVKD
jgi:hypothetical protein